MQNADAVHTFLSSVVQTFLAKHGFKSQPKGKAKGDMVATPRKRRKINRDDSSSENRQATLTIPQGPAPMPIVIPGTNADVDEEANLLWTDPRTGQTFVVDKRTGNSYPLQPDDGDEGNQAKAGMSSGRRTLRLKPVSKTPVEVLGHDDDGQSSDVASDITPPWIRDALGVRLFSPIYERGDPDIHFAGE